MTITERWRSARRRRLLADLLAIRRQQLESVLADLGTVSGERRR